MMVTRRTMELIAPAVVLAASATLVRPAAAAQPANLLEVLTMSRDLSKFVELVKAAGLEQELTKPGRWCTPAVWAAARAGRAPPC